MEIFSLHSLLFSEKTLSANKDLYSVQLINEGKVGEV